MTGQNYLLAALQEMIPAVDKMVDDLRPYPFFLDFDLLTDAARALRIANECIEALSQKDVEEKKRIAERCKKAMDNPFPSNRTAEQQEERQVQPFGAIIVNGEMVEL